MLLMPVCAVSILDEAKRSLRLLDKQLGAALGFKNAYDWSKAKHNSPHRPLNFHDLCAADDETQRAIQQAWGAALDRNAQFPPADRDLVNALLVKVADLIAVMDPWTRTAKAELTEHEERKRA